MKSGSSRKGDLLVCDTGPVLALGRIGFLPVVSQLYASCLLTDTVMAECLAKPLLPDALVVQQAVESGILKVLRAPPVRSSLAELDAGERSAVELALRLKATVLLDEKRGREQARHLGVRLIGFLGLLFRVPHMRGDEADWSRIFERMANARRLRKWKLWADAVALCQ